MKQKNVMDIKKRFGFAIKARRYELGISQEILAEKAGLHRTYIGDVERGARNLSIENIEKIANALEMPLHDLFKRTEE